MPTLQGCYEIKSKKKKVIELHALFYALYTLFTLDGFKNVELTLNHLAKEAPVGCTAKLSEYHRKPNGQ